MMVAPHVMLLALASVQQVSQLGVDANPSCAKRIEYTQLYPAGDVNPPSLILGTHYAWIPSYKRDSNSWRIINRDGSEIGDIAEWADGILTDGWVDEILENGMEAAIDEGWWIPLEDAEDEWPPSIKEVLLGKTGLPSDLVGLIPDELFDYIEWDKYLYGLKRDRSNPALWFMIRTDEEGGEVHGAVDSLVLPHGALEASEIVDFNAGTLLLKKYPDIYIETVDGKGCCQLTWDDEGVQIWGHYESHEWDDRYVESDSRFFDYSSVDTRIEVMGESWTLTLDDDRYLTIPWRNGGPKLYDDLPDNSPSPTAEFLSWVDQDVVPLSVRLGQRAPKWTRIREDCETGMAWGTLAHDHTRKYAVNDLAPSSDSVNASVYMCDPGKADLRLNDVPIGSKLKVTVPVGGELRCALGVTNDGVVDALLLDSSGSIAARYSASPAQDHERNGIEQFEFDWNEGIVADVESTYTLYVRMELSDHSACMLVWRGIQFSVIGPSVLDEMLLAMQTPEGYSLATASAVLVLIGIWMMARPGPNAIARWIPLVLWLSASGSPFFGIGWYQPNKELLFVLIAAEMGALVAIAGMSPVTFRLVSTTAPFDLICPLLVQRPRVRRRLYAQHVNKLQRWLKDEKRRASRELYFPVPAIRMGPERDEALGEPIVRGTNEPVESLWELCGSKAPSDRSHVLIEAPGGRGKSAIMREFLQHAIDAFRKNPRSPIPVFCEGKSPDVKASVRRALASYSFSEDVLNSQLEQGGLIILFDDLKDAQISSDAIERYVAEDSFQSSMIGCTRPSEEYERAFHSASSWCVLRPGYLTEDNIDAFASRYTEREMKLSDQVKTVCRVMDGRFLPILVRFAAMFDSEAVDDVPGLYREVFCRLVEEDDGALSDWTTEKCVRTFWDNGTREIGLASLSQDEKENVDRLRDAGILINADRNFFKRPQAVRFFHDSMQTFLTAWGLMRIESAELDLIRAAGDTAFASEAGIETESLEEAELFWFLVRLWRPSSALRSALIECLEQSLSDVDEELTKREVHRALTLSDSRDIAEDGATEVGAGETLRRALSRSDELSVDEMGLIFVRLAPSLYAIRNNK